MTKRLTTVHRPYPVVGLIIPWNFPFANAGARRDPRDGRGRRGAAEAVGGHAR